VEVQKNPIKRLGWPVHAIATPAKTEKREGVLRDGLAAKARGERGVVRRQWSPEDLEQVIMVKINERLKSNNGAIFQAITP